jgi:hypothetical protein
MIVGFRTPSAPCSAVRIVGRSGAVRMLDAAAPDRALADRTFAVRVLGMFLTARPALAADAARVCSIALASPDAAPRTAASARVAEVMLFPTPSEDTSQK